MSPALSVIEYMKKNTSQYRLVYVGRVRALEGDTAESWEKREVTSLGVPFYDLVTGRLQRSFTPYTATSLLKVPVGFVQSFYYLMTIKPALVVSFGGYVALPLSLAACCLHIPVVTHEQTRVMGLTNRIISRFAARVCLSWKETERVPNGVQTVLTGNPIRLAIVDPGKSLFWRWGHDQLPLLYVTGGSTGSHSINTLVSQAIGVLVSRYRIIHQCGKSHDGQDYVLLGRIKESLPASMRSRYQVVQHLNTQEIGRVYKEADVVIGRSGANTVSELLFTHARAVLIPLPWAADGEQEKNATMLMNLGQGVILRQEELTSDRFVETIDEMANRKKEKKAKPREAESKIRFDAAERVIEQIIGILEA